MQRKREIVTIFLFFATKYETTFEVFFSFLYFFLQLIHEFLKV